MFISISEVNSLPLFVMVNYVHSSPSQTLQVNVTVVDILHVLSHRSVFIAVAYFLQGPAIWSVF